MHRRPSGWDTHFGRWVCTYGTSELAETLGVTRHALYHWIAGRRSPTADRALQIVSLSHGRLSLDCIYHQRELASPSSQAQAETPCESTSR